MRAPCDHIRRSCRNFIFRCVKRLVYPQECREGTCAASVWDPYGTHTSYKYVHKFISQSLGPQACTREHVYIIARELVRNNISCDTPAFWQLMIYQITLNTSVQQFIGGICHIIHLWNTRTHQNQCWLKSVVQLLKALYMNLAVPLIRWGFVSFTRSIKLCMLGFNIYIYLYILIVWNSRFVSLT